MSNQSDSPSDSLPSIPGFEFMGQVGRGGMGIVYKARQLEPDRLVAIKMIALESGIDFLSLARFRIEAEAVACLSHPNIIEIHQVGVHDGNPYFALEYAEGGNLASASGSIQSPRHAAEIVLGLALAIQSAHDRGILHRDLKPANILLMADGQPKISDFGIAKFRRPMEEVSALHRTITISEAAFDTPLIRYTQEAREQAHRGDPTNLNNLKNYCIERAWKDSQVSANIELQPDGVSMIKEFVSQVEQQTKNRINVNVKPQLNDLTRQGTIMGTPHYMAPEQARGDIENIGPGADIYSLGAVLYHLLTGHAPFTGRDAADIIRKVEIEAPVPLTASVNSELKLICHNCLEKDVNNRYPTASDLAIDLKRFLDGYSINTSQVTAPITGSKETATATYHNTFSAPNTAAHQPLRQVRKWWQFW